MHFFKNRHSAPKSYAFLCIIYKTDKLSFFIFLRHIDIKHECEIKKCGQPLPLVCVLIFTFGRKYVIIIYYYIKTLFLDAEVLNKTNVSICENNSNKMFVTVWFGIPDIATSHVTAANRKLSDRTRGS